MRLVPIEPDRLGYFVRFLMNVNMDIEPCHLIHQSPVKCRHRLRLERKSGFAPIAGPNRQQMIDEIAGGMREWYGTHPEMRGDERKLYAFSRDFGWQKNGPGVLASCPFYDQNGWLGAATHGWYSTMQEYADRSKLETTNLEMPRRSRSW